MLAYRITGVPAERLLAVAERQGINVADVLRPVLPDVVGVQLVTIEPVVLELRTRGSQRPTVETAVLEALRRYGWYEYLPPGSWQVIEYQVPAAGEAVGETINDLAEWSPWAGAAALVALAVGATVGVAWMLRR